MKIKNIKEIKNIYKKNAIVEKSTAGFVRTIENYTKRNKTVQVQLESLSFSQQIRDGSSK